MQKELTVQNVSNAPIQIRMSFPEGIKAADFGFMFGLGLFASIGLLTLLIKVARYLFNLLF